MWSSLASSLLLSLPSCCLDVVVLRTSSSLDKFSAVKNLTNGGGGGYSDDIRSSVLAVDIVTVCLLGEIGAVDDAVSCECSLC